jgi:hypothetical protein
MIWNYVVVTERVNKIGRTEMNSSPCITLEQVKEDIDNFLKWHVENPAAVKGVHYNYAVFAKDPDYVYTGDEK